MENKEISGIALGWGTRWLTYHVSGYFDACVKLEGALPQALLYSDL